MGIIKGIAGLIKTLAALAFLVIVIAIIAAVGSGTKTSDEISEEINIKVVDDAMNQYIIAKKHGSMMDRCVQAGLVSAALLQAKAEAQYAEWRPIEKADYKKAGVRK